MSASARVAIVLAILLLLPIVFGPIVVGVLIERGLDRVRASGATPGVDIEFERGLYTSRARTSLAVDRTDGTAGAITLDHVIVHGPIPLAAPAIGRSPLDLVVVLVDSKLAPDLEMMPGVEQALDGEALATAFTRVGPRGDVESKIVSPAFELAGGRFVWAGLEGRIELVDDMTRVSGDVTVEGLRIADDQVSLAMQPGTARFDADLRGQRLEAQIEQQGTEWVFGDQRFSSGAVRIEADQPLGGDLLGDATSTWTIERIAGAGSLGEGDFEMSGIEIEQVVERNFDSGLHRGELGLAFETWRVGDDPVEGPGGLRMHVARIDRAAVQRFQAALQELEESGAPPDQIEAMRPFVVMEHLPALLASSPALDVRDAFVDAPDGRAEATFHLTVDGSEPELLTDPFMMMSLIEAHASVEGTDPLLRRLADRMLPALYAAPPVAPQADSGLVVSNPDAADPGAGEVPLGEAIDRVDVWLEDGTLVQEGERLTFEARFENGMPMLNGQPADPELITNLMPGM